MPLAPKTFDGAVPERRAHPRITCKNTAAELTVVHGGVAKVTTIPAIVIDVSKSGVRVIANTRTGPGEQVRVKMDRLIIFGEVRHCHAQGAMFESGVRISDVVGDHGLCDRLSEEQIEILALGRPLPATERLYAKFHLLRCGPCAEQLRATRTLFAKLPALKGSSMAGRMVRTG